MVASTGEKPVVLLKQMLNHAILEMLDSFLSLNVEKHDCRDEIMVYIIMGLSLTMMLSFHGR